MAEWARMLTERRARIVRRAENYAWSSARAHATGQEDALLTRAPELEAEIGDWAQFLRSPDDEAWARQLQESSRTGRPMGSESFIAGLERMLGRGLRPKAAGRPAKKGRKDK